VKRRKTSEVAGTRKLPSVPEVPADPRRHSSLARQPARWANGCRPRWPFGSVRREPRDHPEVACSGSSRTASSGGVNAPARSWRKQPAVKRRSPPDRPDRGVQGSRHRDDSKAREPAARCARRPTSLAPSDWWKGDQGLRVQAHPRAGWRAASAARRLLSTGDRAEDRVALTCMAISSSRRCARS